MEAEPSFIKGSLVTLSLYLIAIPVGLVPLVGQLVAITLVPYLAAALGARFARPKERLPLAITCSLIWSGTMTLVLLLVMREISSGYSPMGFRIGSIAWLVISVIWVLNTLFTILGALHPWRDPFREPGI
ncbi:MAG: hypothetical protein ACMUHY_00410 [Thermoplasmatota archaeon]